MVSHAFIKFNGDLMGFNGILWILNGDLMGFNGQL